MSETSPYHDNVELDSYRDEEHNQADDPDAPLPYSHSELGAACDRDLLDDTGTSWPRWLQRAPYPARRWLQRANNHMATIRPKWLAIQHSTWTDKTLHVLRPRLTVGYVLFVLVAAYVLYCYITWSPLFASKLPQYTGTYPVGAIDLEVPVAEPRTVVDAVLKSTGKPAFHLDTVLLTIYYPAIHGARSSVPQHKWIAKPISLTAEGYATAAHFNNFFSRTVFTFALWALAGSIKIPALVDVPLSQGSGGGKSDAQFPIIVLSHGDVSSRTDYTAYCGELASRGVVVAAIEHRDGSCPGSVVHLPDGTTRNIHLFRADQLESTKPDEEVSNDDWRFKKLAFRDAEIQEVIYVLKRANEGHGDQLYSQNYRGEGKDLASWEGRLDFSRVVIAGHSFGATGALQALRSANKTAPSDAGYHNPAVGGIIMDPGKSSGRLNTDINVPLLIAHSDSWSKEHTIFYGRPHFDTVREIAVDVLKRCGAAWFMTSLKTSHPSVTDAPLIEPLLLSWTTGASISVREGLREYVRISMEFLRFLRDGHRSGVLDIGVTHEEYGHDTRTDEQKRRMDGSIIKYWEVHVAPPPSFAADE